MMELEWIVQRTFFQADRPTSDCLWTLSCLLYYAMLVMFIRKWILQLRMRREKEVNWYVF